MQTKTSQKIKDVSTLELRKNFGELTNQVLYSDTILKVSKNKRKFFIVPYLESDNDDFNQADKIMQDLEKIRNENNKNNLTINGMSWSEFIKKDRKNRQ